MPTPPQENPNHPARRPRRVIPAWQYLGFLLVMVSLPIPFCLYVADTAWWDYFSEPYHLLLLCVCYAFLLGVLFGVPMSRRIHRAADAQMCAPDKLIATWTYDTKDFVRVVEKWRKRNPLTWRFRTGYRKRPLTDVRVTVYWECIKIGPRMLYWSPRFPPLRHFAKPRLEAVHQFFDVCALQFLHSTRLAYHDPYVRTTHRILVPYSPSAGDEVRKVMERLQHGYDYRGPVPRLFPG
jgi:hypothetical protein